MISSCRAENRCHGQSRPDAGLTRCLSRHLAIAFVITLMAGTAVESLAQRATGLGILVPIVARATGAGDTLYLTSIDITNHRSELTLVDFYFDGADARTGAAVHATGSVGDGRLVVRGERGMPAASTFHSADFVKSLADGGFIPAATVDNGVIGSLLVVFNQSARRGEGAVTARFYNPFGGGTVGSALRGRELTATEPRVLRGVIHDTRAATSAAPKVYSNVIINHTGLTPAGVATSQDVQVELRAWRRSEPVGSAATVVIPSGRTLILPATETLNLPAPYEALRLSVAVVSGDAAIAGVISQVDAVTRDGSVFEMSPGE
jgi:hypothetical protein